MKNKQQIQLIGFISWNIRDHEKLLYLRQKNSPKYTSYSPQFIRLQMYITHFTGPSIFMVYAFDLVMLPHPETNYDEHNL